MSIRFAKVVKSARRGKKLAKKFTRHFIWIVLGFVLLLVGSAYLVWYQEYDFQGSYADALWTVLFTLVGQGEFATNPRTVPGRVTVFVLSIVGVALLGVIFSELIQRLMTSKLKEMMGMSRCGYKGHTLICGWNERGRHILKELEATGKPAALIAKERPPFLPADNVFFVAGSPSDEEILMRAGIKEADTAIILADSRGGGGGDDVDARTILTALAVEATHPEIYSIIELTNPANERHARLAQVDDIIYCDSLIAEVTATCAVYAGISVFMKDILCASDEGHRFAAFPVASEYEGETVGTLFGMYRKDGYLPVGIILPPQNEPDAPLGLWRSRVNPPEADRVRLPMKIVCIAKNERDSDA